MGHRVESIGAARDDPDTKISSSSWRRPCSSEVMLGLRPACRFRRRGRSRCRGRSADTRSCRGRRRRRRCPSPGRRPAARRCTSCSVEVVVAALKQRHDVAAKPVLLEFAFSIVLITARRARRLAGVMPGFTAAFTRRSRLRCSPARSTPDRRTSPRRLRLRVEAGRTRSVPARVLSFCRESAPHVMIGHHQPVGETNEPDRRY